MFSSANFFTVLFLLALGVSVALQLWLARRQVRHVTAHRSAVPAHFAGRIALSAHQKAADYTFVVEQRFGFNRMTLGLWLKDLIKAALIGVVLGLPLVTLVLWLMARAGSLWWFYAWLAWVGFQALLLALYPTVIAPLFNKFRPLADVKLKERVERLLARCGFAAKGLFVMDGSTRSSHGNAYFTGFGAARRIVFFDTLLERLQPEEVEAVLAHE